MRNYNSETFRLKACLDETIEQLDAVKRENKNLAEEIRDVLEQVKVILISILCFIHGRGVKGRRVTKIFNSNYIVFTK